MNKITVEIDEGNFVVSKDAVEIKVCGSRFELDKFLTILWENGELNDADKIDIYNTLNGCHPIREFDSRPTWYKLEDGKIWEQSWNSWEGYYYPWKEFTLDKSEVQKYWTAISNCVTRDVTDTDYDESKFEV
jgi:hypothetical protein